jgi:LysM repeat protein
VDRSLKQKPFLAASEECSLLCPLENVVPGPSLPTLLALVLGLTLSIGDPVSAKKPSKKPTVSKEGSRARGARRGGPKSSQKVSGTHTYHQVTRGDTLGEIAEKYGCSAKSIMRANRLKKDSVIRIGKKLKVPKKCTRSRGSKKRPAEGKAKAVVHTITSGETLGEIAARYGTSVEDITKRNRIRGDFIRTGQRLEVVPTVVVRPRTKQHYRIQPRDTLITIAQQFGMTWQEIKRLNPRVRDEQRLKIGQILMVYNEGPEKRSQAVGRPNSGRLVNGEQLAAGPGYYRRRPHLAWGTNETIINLTQAIVKVRAAIRGLHNIAVGDLSAKKGGRLPPHKSHQTGRDVDIGFWFTNQPKGGPQGFISGIKHPLHVSANWAFIEALAGKTSKASKVEYIFLDYRIQARLYRYAKRRGVPKKRLDWLFQFPRGRRAMRGVIRHAKGHDDHFHIRFKCPPGDNHCA